MRSIAAAAVAFGVMLAMNVAAVPAPSPEPFFKGKNITVYAGGPAGGGYDFYARLIARHIGRHLPGAPGFMVSNVPGGGGLIGVNLMYNVAAKDGTALGVIRQSVAEDQATQMEGVRYDVLKFNWIGRIGANVELSYVWHTTPIKALEDVKRRETLLASVGGSLDDFPLLLNEVIGTRFKIVKGYHSTAEGELAVQRGEVDGSYSSVNAMATIHKDWTANKLVRILVQFGLARHSALPEIPSIVEFGKTSEDRALFEFLASSSAVGRTVVAPPDVPAERIGELRDAFNATMADPEFLADAGKIGAEISPLPADELKKIMVRTLNASATVLARARAVH
ncbi:MAG: tripartite tricarboxylate transporter substrate-binding protein [Xanthobacteraceae bacterium]